MKTHDDLAVAAGHSVDPGRWLDMFDELMGRIAGRFCRVEPRRRTGDLARCRVAGIPAGTVFATKPQLARAMIGRALDAGAPADWVAGDEVYGGDPGLRADMEARQVGYVLAVARSHQVNAGAGPRRADKIAARLPREY